MDEDEMNFDPSLKKKKKKKKTGFDIDGALENEEAQPSEPVEEMPENTSSEVKPDVSDLDDFSNLGKKKKKKKKTLDMSELDVALPEDDAKEGLDNDDILDFSNMMKKKKKKKTKLQDGDDLDESGDASQPIENSKDDLTWADTDRDYTYEELLTRVIEIMKERNPELVAGEKKRFVMKPPQVMRVGAKKTSFANFTEICKMLHRTPKHLLAYLLSELGTSGSVDGNNQLIIKGRFQQKQIEHVLRGYIKEYVTCHTCKSPETLLQKDTRLYFLQCETCGSRCSVSSIKSGFQAVTGRRAAMRARTT